MLLRGAFASRGQLTVVPPPVETDLLCFVEGADEQPDSNGEKLDFRQRHLDVACNHQPFVKYPIKNIDEACCTMVGRWQVESHELATIPHALAATQKYQGKIYGWAELLST